MWNADVVKRAVLGAVNAGLSGVGAEIEREARGIFGVGHGGKASSAGSPPNSQTGRLRASVKYLVRNDLSVRVGTDVKYGLYLEKGADILPHGKRLAIPLSKDAKRMTAMGMKPRNIILAAKLDRNRPLRYIPTKGGDTLIVRDYSRTGWSRSSGGKWSRKGGYNAKKTGEPFFLLARAAKIKERPWLRPAFQRAKPRLVNRFTAEANRAFRGGLRVAATAGGGR